eukprot:11151117-Heterocapsa_arctica.AAC.1
MRFTYDEGAGRTPLDSPGKHTDVNPNATYETKTIEHMEQERGEKYLPRTTWMMCRWRRTVHGRGCTENAEVRTSKFHAIDVITVY